jgi:putative membrane protein
VAARTIDARVACARRDAQAPSQRMFVTYSGTVLGLVAWQWRWLLVYLCCATAVTVADRIGHFELVEVGTMPLAVLGGAVGIFVSFRTNSCYDRWWEGRRLWGQLVNTSRHLATQALSYIDVDTPEGEAAREAIVRRHVGYVHVLRCVLRGQDPWSDPHVQRTVDAQMRARLAGESNANHAMLHEQTLAVAGFARTGRIDDLRLQLFDRSISTLLDVQGGCERIKRTPFPPGYGFLATRLIVLYSALMPMGLVDALGWVVIPLTLVVCLAFVSINEVGRVLEDPFTMFWPALPLTALSIMIEVNLRQRLGDRDLPPLEKPNDKGILM